MFLKPSKGQLKFLAGLDQAKIRRREGRFLAEGVKIVQEALRSAWGIEYFLVRAIRRSLEAPASRTWRGRRSMN